jgi:hypothetical protein
MTEVRLLAFHPPPTAALRPATTDFQTFQQGYHVSAITIIEGLLIRIIEGRMVA